jgi:hypothetical protein
MFQTSPSEIRWFSGASRLLQRGLRAATRSNRPKHRPVERSERRSDRRLKVEFEAVLSDPSGSLQVRGVDIHRDGALVLSRLPFAPGSVVFVRLKSFELVGFAEVRHCAERGASAYALGLEFPSPLMREEAGDWHFDRVCQSGNGWTKEWEVSTTAVAAF